MTLDFDAAAIVLKYSRLHRHLREDIEGEAALAALVAARSGRPQAEAVEAALRRLIAPARREFTFGHVDGAHHEGIFTGEVPVPGERARRLTPGQRTRLRRNIAIQVCHRGGLSRRHIADVFGLPRSEISVILAKDLAAAFRPAPP